MIRRLFISLSILGAALLAQPSSSVFSQQPQLLAIHDIQGSGSTSPVVGQTVTTTGVVTAIRNNGFFLQAPTAQADDDPNTSEGIFVFRSNIALPALVMVGATLQVTGLVTEFRPASDPNGLTLTELTPPLTITLAPTPLPLPAPITLTAADVSPAGALTQLEKYEGMLVRVERLTVVAPTGGSINETQATATSNGIFLGVIDHSRPFREPGTEPFDPPLPANAPCCIPRFDGNPEVLRVDTRAIINNSFNNTLDVAVGDTVTSLNGPLDYAIGRYTILQATPSATTRPLVFSNSAGAQPVTAPAPYEFTIASFNLQRFFDTTDDTGISDAVLTAAAFATRLNKISLTVRDVLRAPDIIGVQEVENLTTLQAIATKINDDAVASGGANSGYQAYLVEGNDPGGIDVGFLVKGARTRVDEVVQLGKDATYLDPLSNQQATLNDRPPLLLRAVIQNPAGGLFAVTVIVNHLRSLLSLTDPATGARVRAKRLAQAEFLANLIQARQTANPNELIVAIGDFNAFQFSDGYVDSIGSIKGTPTPANGVLLPGADLVNPDLINLTELLNPEQRYSYIFNGSAQTIDHVLITSNLRPLLSRYEIARSNADFPEALRNVPTRPERVSDHDAPIAYFTFPTLPATFVSLNAAGFTGLLAARESINAAFGTNLATITATATTLPLPTMLGGVSLRVTDRLGVETLAPLFFVSPQQINYLLPANVAPGTARLTVVRSDMQNAAGVLAIENVAPGLFTANSTGRGLAAAAVLRVRSNGAQVYEPVARFDPALNQFVAVPIDVSVESEQVFLILFGTGLRHRRDLATVSARLGLTNAEVLFAGAQGELAGLDQVNLRLPRTLAGSGETDVVVTVEGKQTNAVKINIK
jgi:uncharacterized protein